MFNESSLFCAFGVRDLVGVLVFTKSLLGDTMARIQKERNELNSRSYV